MATAELPPGPSSPRFVQDIYAGFVPLRGLPRVRDRYGDTFMFALTVGEHLASAPAKGGAAVVHRRPSRAAGPGVAPAPERNASGVSSN